MDATLLEANSRSRHREGLRSSGNLQQWPNWIRFLARRWQHRGPVGAWPLGSLGDRRRRDRPSLGALEVIGSTGSNSHWTSRSGKAQVELAQWLQIRRRHKHRNCSSETGTASGKERDRRKHAAQQGSRPSSSGLARRRVPRRPVGSRRPRLQEALRCA